MPAANLPAWKGKQQLPATVNLPIPVENTGKGPVYLSVLREGGSNVVLGELWVTAD